MSSLIGQELETSRLRLRPVAVRDAGDLFAIFSDPMVMRYWNTPPWTRPEQASEMIEREAAGLAAGTSVRLAVVRAGDGALVGTFSLFALDEQSRRAEIGYALASSAWGQGYAHEAGRAVIRHAFGVLGLNRLEADIDPRNEASARVLERLGFRREGLLRERWIVAGEVSDSALYGLLRKDWRSGT
jgi:RimJ/RimL family protein N-acetyltransferase